MVPQGESGFDSRHTPLLMKSIPIYICAKDRASYLETQVEHFWKTGYQNLIILDMGSTWAPMLDLLQSLERRGIAKVCRLGEPDYWPKKALWLCGQFDLSAGPFAYTDCDVVPDCGSNWAEYLWSLLVRYPDYQKAGLGLRTDDLPECYKLRDAVQTWESRWYVNAVEPNVYDSGVDTTLAVYRPGAGYCIRALRTGGPFLARHLAWYEDSTHPTEEKQHYLKHIHPQAGHWSKLEKQPDKKILRA